MKPDNVMIDYEGHIKLIDFGFATKFSKNEDTLVVILGSPLYMAPELVEQKYYS